MLKGLCVFSKNIEKAEKAGFDYVVLPGFEIAAMSESDFEALCQRVKNLKIPVIGYNSYCKDDVPIVGDNFDPKKAESYAKLLCARASKLGIKNIGIGAPAARRLPKDYDISKANAQGKEFITITAVEAQKYGINVLVEGLNKYCCDFVTYVPLAYELMSSVKMENVSMIIDFYHAKLNEEEFESFIKFLPYCKDIHISGCTENRARPFVDETNANELDKISRILKKGNYNISVTLEPDHTDDNFEIKAKRAFEIMSKYF